MSALFLVALFIVHFFATILDELLYGDGAFSSEGLANRLGIPDGLGGIDAGDFIFVSFNFFRTLIWKMIAWDYRFFQGELVILQFMLIGMTLLGLAWGMKELLIAQFTRGVSAIRSFIGLP